MSEEHDHKLRYLDVEKGSHARSRSTTQSLNKGILGSFQLGLCQLDLQFAEPMIARFFRSRVVWLGLLAPKEPKHLLAFGSTLILFSTSEETTLLLAIILGTNHISVIDLLEIVVVSVILANKSVTV